MFGDDLQIELYLNINFISSSLNIFNSFTLKLPQCKESAQLIIQLKTVNFIASYVNILTFLDLASVQKRYFVFRYL